MATVNTGGMLVTVASAGAATVTATLDTPPTGMCNKIFWIACFAAAATAADVNITNNGGGTSIARLGGAGIGIIGQVLFFDNYTSPARGGVCGLINDATKVVLTTTAGTTTQVAVGYQMGPA